MNWLVKKIAVGSAAALLASATVTGVASAAPGSLASGSLGSTSPGFTSPYTLLPHSDIKAENCSGGENYSTTHRVWEINWGFQYTDQRFVANDHWDSGDFGGLTYVDPQYADKTPAEELAAIRAYDDNPNYSQPYHWWYPSRDMVTNGAELTLAFEDGDLILGEVMVGSDDCPSVRWTYYPADGDPETTVPETFPEGAPAPTRPVLPSDTPTGSLGSLLDS